MICSNDDDQGVKTVHFFYKFLDILAYDPNASVLSCFDIAFPVSVTLNLLVCHGSENPDIHSAISTP